MRFTLTSEAGLNDGLAFPFVYAAIAVGTGGLGPGEWFSSWLAVDVLYRVAAGVACGLATGWLLNRLMFRRAPGGRLSETGDGFVALAATFLAYGTTELIEGYGFIAVFICACTIRAGERAHGYHSVMHGFVQQIERLLTAMVLVLFGGAIARGLFTPLTVADIAVALAILLLSDRFRPGWRCSAPPAGSRTCRHET